MYHSYIHVIPERNIKAKFEENPSELRLFVFQFFVSCTLCKTKNAKKFQETLIETNSSNNIM